MNFGRIVVWFDEIIPVELEGNGGLEKIAKQQTYIIYSFTLGARAWQRLKISS